MADEPMFAQVMPQYVTKEPLVQFQAQLYLGPKRVRGQVVVIEATCSQLEAIVNNARAQDGRWPR